MTETNLYVQAIIAPRQYPDIKAIPQEQWSLIAEGIIPRAKEFLDQAKNGGMYPSSFTTYWTQLCAQAEKVSAGESVDGLRKIIESKPRE